MNRTLTALFVAAAFAAPAAAQCGFNDMQFSVSPANPTVGQPITITGTNTSTGCIWNLSDSCLIDFVKKTDCNGPAVFTPACAQVITPIQPGTSKSFTWDQKDDFGTQVAPGNYAFDVKLTNQNGQPLNHCITFSISGGCTTPPILYGSPDPGTGGIVPTIGTSGGLPQIGNGSFTIDIQSGLGGAPALLFISANSTNFPAPWGTLLVDLTPPFIQLPFALGGAAGAPGAGSLVLPAPIPNNGGLVGATVFMQCLIGDAGSSDNISHTAGLTFGICP